MRGKMSAAAIHDLLARADTIQAHRRLRQTSSAINNADLRHAAPNFDLRAGVSRKNMLLLQYR